MTNTIQHALVTGGAGFIGSHLVDALLHLGARVSVIDNFSAGRKENLLEAGAAITVHEGELQDRNLLQKAMRDVDVVFHQAAVVSVPLSVEQPLASAAVNEIGTLEVLEAARQAGCRRVVLASSSAVYGDDPELPKQETMDLQALSPYAVQKIAGEYYAGLYHRLYGLETTCLRYFNVFGPRQDPSSPYSGVISLFMTCAVNGQTPVIYGDGEQTRDFVYVRDVITANLRAATAASAAGKIYNIATGRPVSINHLWQLVAEIASCPRTPEYRESRAGDIRHSVAAVDAARRDLEFSPETKFEDGLAMTFNWYQNA